MPQRALDRVHGQGVPGIQVDLLGTVVDEDRDLVLVVGDLGEKEVAL
jgi:hypothetical protein